MKMQKKYCICKEDVEDKYIKDKYRKFSDHYCHFTREYRAGAHKMCSLKYSAPNKIDTVFHNGFNKITVF